MKFVDYVYSDRLDEGIENKMPILASQFKSKMEHLLSPRGSDLGVRGAKEIFGLDTYPDFNGIIKFLLRIDPTGRKAKYITFLCRAFIENPLLFRGEDREKLHDLLLKFDNFSKRGNWPYSRDINTYLIPALDPRFLYTTDTIKPLIQAIREYTGITKTEEILKDVSYIEQNNLRMYIISDARLLSKIAEDTYWCVKSVSVAQYYINRGKFLYISKNKDPYVLIHEDSYQVKDINDTPISKEIANEIYNLIKDNVNFERIINDVDSTIKSLINDIRQELEYENITRQNIQYKLKYVLQNIGVVDSHTPLINWLNMDMGMVGDFMVFLDSNKYDKITFSSVIKEYINEH